MTNKVAVVYRNFFGAIVAILSIPSIFAGLTFWVLGIVDAFYTRGIVWAIICAIPMPGICFTIGFHISDKMLVSPCMLSFYCFIISSILWNISWNIFLNFYSKCKN